MPASSYPTSVSLEDSIILPVSGLHPEAMDPSVLNGPGESIGPRKERYPMPTSELYPTDDNGGPSKINANVCRARICILSITKKFRSFLNSAGKSTVNAIEAATMLPVIEGVDPAGQGSAVKSGEGVTEYSSDDDLHPQTAETFEKQLSEVKWLSASMCIDMIGNEIGVQFKGENGVDGKGRAGLEEMVANMVSRCGDSSLQEDDGDREVNYKADAPGEALEAEAVVINIVNLLEGEGIGYLEVIEGEGVQDHNISYCGRWNEAHS